MDDSPSGNYPRLPGIVEATDYRPGARRPAVTERTDRRPEVRSLSSSHQRPLCSTPPCKNTGLVKCGDCRALFCINHHRVYDHSCPMEYLKLHNNDSHASTSQPPFCSRETCKRADFGLRRCKTCGSNFCAIHYYERKHTCVLSTVPVSAGALTAVPSTVPVSAGANMAVSSTVPVSARALTAVPSTVPVSAGAHTAVSSTVPVSARALTAVPSAVPVSAGANMTVSSTVPVSARALTAVSAPQPPPPETRTVRKKGFMYAIRTLFRKARPTASRQVHLQSIASLQASNPPVSNRQFTSSFTSDVERQSARESTKGELAGQEIFFALNVA